MTVTDEKENANQPHLPACPNCGAIGTLRPLAMRADMRRLGTDIEFRCSSCHVVIVHSTGGS